MFLEQILVVLFQSTKSVGDGRMAGLTEDWRWSLGSATGALRSEGSCWWERVTPQLGTMPKMVRRLEVSVSRVEYSCVERCRPIIIPLFSYRPMGRCYGQLSVCVTVSLRDSQSICLSVCVTVRLCDFQSFCLVSLCDYQDV